MSRDSFLVLIVATRYVDDAQLGVFDACFWRRETGVGDYLGLPRQSKEGALKRIKCHGTDLARCCGSYAWQRART